MSTNSNREKKLLILTYFIFLIIPILMYAKYYFNDQMPGTADLVQFFSGRKYFAECLWNGELPQWNSYLANGIPQTGNFYILSILLAILPLKQYIYAFFIIHLFVGSFFFCKYLRECGCSFKISILFGIIYECSIQINGLRLGHPSIIASICLFPVIMYFVKKYFNEKNNKWLLYSAAVAGIQATAGKQYSVYAILILFIYILILCIVEKFTYKDIVKKGCLWLIVYIGISAVDLLTNFSTMHEYSQYGSAKISYETFCTWSIHPVKLIQMIIPKFFGDAFQAFGNNYSSDADIELYLGIFVLLLMISAMIKYKNKPGIRLDTLCAVIAFLYASIAHIPILNRIVYHIPLLGGFRNPARFLYIFYFFVLSLAAMGLHYAIQNDICNKQVSCMRKICGIILSCTMMIAASSAFLISLIVEESQRMGYFLSLKNILLKPICFFIIILGILFILEKRTYLKRKFSEQWCKRLLCYAVLVITLLETLPYSLMIAATPLNKFEVSDAVEKRIKKEIGNYKIWDVINTTFTAQESFVSQNKAAVKEIAAINSYTAYNNPLVFRYFKNLGDDSTAAGFSPLGITDPDSVPFNSSGLFTGSCNAVNNILFQNDLLSMLGVRYLIDSSHVIENTGGAVYDSQCNTIPVYNKENIVLDLQEDGTAISTIINGVSANTCYQVRFKIAEDDNTELTFLAADLYGGESYDPGAQEKHFYITEESEYITYLYSMGSESATEDVRLRIFARSNTRDIKIEKCEISVVEPRQAYTYWGTDQNGTKIYENISARNILYFPDQISEMKEFEDIYDNYEKYALDRVAYVNNTDKNLNSKNSSAEVLSRTSNTLTAKVNAVKDTYLCFSQNYSKNWSVKIDGKKQSIDMVNGLIIGTEIPEGEHTVVFEYQDPSYVIGLIITGLTVLILIIFNFYNLRDKSRKL